MAKFIIVLSLLFFLTDNRLSAQVTTADDFILIDTDGNWYHLYEMLDSGKVVLLDFWFYGCAPCVKSIPTLDSLYTANSSNKECLIVLGLNVATNNSTQKVIDYKNYWGVKYPVFANDSNNNVPSSLLNPYSGGNSVPYFAIIKPDRSVFYSELGWTEEKMENLSNIIDSTLNGHTCDSLAFNQAKPTGITVESGNAINVCVFPNPIDDAVTIQYFGRDAVLKIYDLSSKLVKIETIKKNSKEIQQVEIDLSDLSNGIFILSLAIDNDAINYHKVIKK